MHLPRTRYVIAENIARFGDQAFAIQAYQKFVIDVQAPRVEVGGAGIDHGIHDDQLGVQDLRLVFVISTPARSNRW